MAVFRPFPARSNELSIQDQGIRHQTTARTSAPVTHAFIFQYQHFAAPSDQDEPVLSASKAGDRSPPLIPDRYPVYGKKECLFAELFTPPARTNQPSLPDEITA